MTGLGGCLLADGASLLLDLDGTLVDSEPASRTAYRRYFRRRGWDVPEDSPAGIAAARAAGAGVILGVTTSLAAAVLTAAGATHTSATLEVLLPR